MENKIYAVRRPAEAKGVYLTVDEMKKMQRQHPKGFSVKPFEAKDVELAKEWAGVKGTSGTPILTVKKKVAQKQEITPKQIEKEHPIQAVLNSYQKKGYRHFELQLVTGETMYITPKDMVYLTDLHFDINRTNSVDLTNYSKDLTRKAYNSSDCHPYEVVILAHLRQATKPDLAYVKDAIRWNLIDCLEKTTIEYCEDFILLTNFNYKKDAVYLRKNDQTLRPQTSDLEGDYTDDNGLRPCKDNRGPYPRQTRLEHKNQTVAINLNQIAKIQPTDFEINTSGLKELQHLATVIKQAKKEMQ